MSSKRIPSLDGLRALAIGLVLVEHSGCTWLPHAGTFGVQLFFVISGYLITRLLLEEREKHGRINLRAFYLRRCFRIFPAAFAYIAVVSAFSPSARRDIVWAVTYLMSYCQHPSIFVAHLWSLSVEEQFYLLWPLALVLCFSRRASVVWGAVAVAAVARLAGAALWPGESWLLYRCFPCVADSLAAGCLLAICEKQLARRWHPGKASAALLPVAAYWTALVLWGHESSVIAWGLIPMLLAGFVYAAVRCAPRVLNNRAAYAVGALSYSLYLWQQPFVIGPRVPAYLTFFFLAVSSGASYLLVEQPMIALGRRLAAPDKQRVKDGARHPSHLPLTASV